MQESHYFVDFLPELTAKIDMSLFETCFGKQRYFGIQILPNHSSQLTTVQ
jgi:hypothetical protein